MADPPALDLDRLLDPPAPVGRLPLPEDFQRDTDSDGLDDGTEILTGTDPLRPDTDSDGLDDGVEVLQQRTDPRSVDTDGDGLTDGHEVGAGLDPVAPDGFGVLAAEAAYSPDLVAPETAQADPAAPGDVDDHLAAPDDIDDDLIALDTSSSADDFDAYGLDPQPLPPAQMELPEDLPDDDIGEPGLDAVPVPDDLQAFGQGATDDDTDLGFNVQQHMSDLNNATVIAGRIAGAGGGSSGTDFGHGDTSGAETATEHGLLDEAATEYSRPEPDSDHASPTGHDTPDSDDEPEAEIDAYESVDDLDDLDDFAS